VLAAPATPAVVAVDMSAKRATMRTLASSPDGRTKATTQPLRQPSTPASHMPSDAPIIVGDDGTDAVRPIG